MPHPMKITNYVSKHIIRTWFKLVDPENSFSEPKMPTSKGCGVRVLVHSKFSVPVFFWVLPRLSDFEFCPRKFTDLRNFAFRSQLIYIRLTTKNDGMCIWTCQRSKPVDSSFKQFQSASTVAATHQQYILGTFGIYIFFFTFHWLFQLETPYTESEI